ncbi:hypothetical protein Zmor_009215 [Zophobas morio]|uniref:Uncharacterized protein n=1 Tax=Zophobas morio TaxID=2755281 RepID=A0AA38ILK3_9CUCU|nr:hypothetical protein Zmor_009215 [Zophobas morio]
MPKNPDFSPKTLFVHYQAIAEIVLGIWSLLYAVEIYLLTYDDEEFSILYYWFIAGAVLELLKGAILLQGIRTEKKIHVLSYLLLTSILLFVAKGFIIRFGVERYDEIEDLKRDQATDSEIRPTLRGFVFDFVIFYPVVFLFHWLVQFYVFQFYKDLVAAEAVKTANEKNFKVAMIGEKSY